MMLKSPYSDIVFTAIENVKAFYVEHTEIKASHGWIHIQAVLHHTNKALEALDPSLLPPSKEVMQIKLAALLHDMDDKKYFPNNKGYPNATGILQSVGISPVGQTKESFQQIIQMISWVGCSENGNTVPKEVKENEKYYLLIPRWADRLEAVGSRGVVRCYQYTLEKSQPLSTQESPRPQTEEELWTKYATKNKLQEYMDRGGSSTDMISHYYDKLLHIARPPKDIVRNSYLEHAAESGAKDLVEVCLRYGKTGKVDEQFIMSL